MFYRWLAQVVTILDGTIQVLWMSTFQSLRSHHLVEYGCEDDEDIML